MEKNGLYKSLFLKQQILAAKEASQLKSTAALNPTEFDPNEDLILKEIMEGDTFIRQEKQQKLLQLENVLQFVEANDCFDREELKIMIRHAHESLKEMKSEADPYLKAKNQKNERLAPHSTHIGDEDALYNGMDEYEMKEFEGEKKEDDDAVKPKEVQDAVPPPKMRNIDEILNMDENSDDSDNDQKPLLD